MDGVMGKYELSYTGIAALTVLGKEPKLVEKNREFTELLHAVERTGSIPSNISKAVVDFAINSGYVWPAGGY
jgi:hypothetical protein